MDTKLNIVIVCAHPDDPELAAGGITARYLELGHNVTYIVTTTGDGGHHEMDRQALGKRRYDETRKVAKYWGIDYVIMDNHDGQLEPSLKIREELIRVLRKYQPDVIISHGLDDYHPDHRYTGQLVADTAYMLNVPLCVPDAPIARKDVVYCNISYKPCDKAPATVLVPYDKYLDRKIDSVHFHESQIYEWLPWTENVDPKTIAKDEEGRINFLKDRWLPEWETVRKNYAPAIQQHSADQQSNPSKYYEAYTASLWGSPLTPKNVKKYFPFDDAVVF